MSCDPALQQLTLCAAAETTLGRGVEPASDAKRPAFTPGFLFAFLGIVVLNSVHLVPAAVQTALSDGLRRCILNAIAAYGVKEPSGRLGRSGPPRGHALDYRNGLYPLS